MSLVVLSVLGASDCGGTGSKTPQDVLSTAFQALEANNLELWNKTLLMGQRDSNQYRDPVGMINFKKLVGLDAVPAGSKLGLFPGNSVWKDEYGQIANVFEAEVRLNQSGDPKQPSKIVALAKVACTKKDTPECFIEDFLEVAR